LEFAPLAACRRQFAGHVVAPDIEWDAENDPATGHLPLTAPEEGLGDQASGDLVPTLTVT
jgi:hypothetical protein